MYHWCWARYSTKCTSGVGPGIVLSVPVVLGQEIVLHVSVPLVLGQVYMCSTVGMSIGMFSCAHGRL